VYRQTIQKINSKSQLNFAIVRSLQKLGHGTHILPRILYICRACATKSGSNWLSFW